jgi:uncharacterized protein (DUF433 family)
MGPLESVMTLESTLLSARPPVRPETNRSLRVGDTRVPLEAVVHLCRAGKDALGLVDAYPALSSADVLGAIPYYLNHMKEIDAYGAERERQGEAAPDLRVCPEGVRG